MKLLTRACATALILTGLTEARSAMAQAFSNVTPTVTGGAQISGTELVAGPPPAGAPTPVPVPLVSTTITGLNQNVTAGSSSSIFATAFNIYNTSTNSITIATGTGEGYAQSYEPDTTVGCNVSLGVSFQVAASGTYQLSGYGFTQQATSYELGTMYGNGTFTAMQGSNTVLSLQNYEGFQWRSTAGGVYSSSALLDLTLTPGTIYTLDVNCYSTYANDDGTYSAAEFNPRSISSNLTITDLSASVPEPATLSLLAISGSALLRPRRRRQV